METLTRRSCDYHHDLPQLMKLWLAYRAVTDVRAYPTIWRIRLLLTSRVWEPNRDTQIWENVTGDSVAFAMLWRRQPHSTYSVLDIFLHPAVATDEFLSVILQWGDQRLKEIAKAQGVALTAYATVFSSPNFFPRVLQGFGYALVPLNLSEHNVYFAKGLKDAIRPPTLPPGYKIRPLRAVGDLEAYQALYGFSKVNPQHQQELMLSDEYCHLVIVSPDEVLAAYCECSICYAEGWQTGQRFGWIDYVETRPEYQTQGLGKAILTAGLLQLQRWGAEVALLVTITTNTPAVNLYLKTGFEIIDVNEAPSYQKQVAA